MVSRRAEAAQRAARNEAKRRAICPWCGETDPPRRELTNELGELRAMTCGELLDELGDAVSRREAILRELQGRTRRRWQ